MSTEAHPFITIPLETQQASFFQCLEEPSYVKIFKVSRTERCKRNRHTKKIFRRKKICYIRWRNILPEGYHILKKKWWKELVGHPYERGRCSIFPSFFSHCILFFIYLCIFFLLFYFLSLIFSCFKFLTTINHWCLILREKIVVSIWQVFWCSSSGDALTLAHPGSSTTVLYLLPHLGQYVI